MLMKLNHLADSEKAKNLIQTVVDKNCVWADIAQND